MSLLVYNGCATSFSGRQPPQAADALDHRQWQAMSKRSGAMANALCSQWPWNDDGPHAVWDGGGGLYGRTGAPAPGHVMHPELTVLGERLQRPVRLPSEEYVVPYAMRLTPSRLDASVDGGIASAQQQASWHAAAQQASLGLLKVAIIGVSTTAGSGADEPWDLWKRPGAATSTKSYVLRSWGRRLADALSLIAPVHVSISYKNAVAASFYAFCTSAYVPADATVVLVEVTTNVWGSDVGQLVDTIRQAAPRAAVAFVLWPSQAQYTQHLGSRHAKRKKESDLEMMHRTAAQQGAAVVNLPALMSATRVSNKVLWANRGLDRIHPSPQGHLLIGAVTARFVWRHVLGAMCNAGRGGHGSDEGSEPPRLPAGSVARSSRSEICYTRANELPIAGVGQCNFSLVDEGGNKGVAKLGLLSRQVGDTLDMRPWPEPGCRFLHMRLGYLVSAWRETLAGIHISCPGCTWCAAFPSYFPKLNPFPSVQTWAPWNHDETYFTPPGMTVTAITQFLLLTGDSDSCVVRITHEKASGAFVCRRYKRCIPHSQVQNVSEIRIDSLTAASYQLDKNTSGGELLHYWASTLHGPVPKMIARFNETCRNAPTGHAHGVRRP